MKIRGNDHLPAGLRITLWILRITGFVWCLMAVWIFIITTLGIALMIAKGDPSFWMVEGILLVLSPVMAGGMVILTAKDQLRYAHVSPGPRAIPARLAWIRLGEQLLAMASFLFGLGTLAAVILVGRSIYESQEFGLPLLDLGGQGALACVSHLARRKVGRWLSRQYRLPRQGGRDDGSEADRKFQPCRTEASKLPTIARHGKRE